MPERKGKPPYSERQATAWLAWLARGMQQHGQTVFLIEQLQPSWLSGRGQLALYLLASRLAVGVLLGVLWAAIIGPSAILLLFQAGTMEDGSGSIIDFLTSSGTSVVTVVEEGLVEVIAMAAVGTLVLGLLAGLVVSPSGAVLELWRLRAGRFWRMADEAPARWRRLAFSALYFVALTLFCSLVTVVVAGGLFTVFGLIDEGGDAAIGPFVGVLAAFFIGPTFAVVAAPLWGTRAARQSGTREIQTVETLRWSWVGVGKGALIGLIAGLGTALLLKAGPYLMLWLFLMLLLAVVGAVLGAAVNLWARAGVGKALRRGGTAGLGCGLVCSALLGGLALLGGATGTFSTSLGLPWFVWLAAALVGALAGTIFNGLQSRVVALKTVPNQGIRLSLRNAFVGGGLVGLAFGFAGAAGGYALGRWVSSQAGVGPALGPLYGTLFGILAALAAGLYAGLWYGGADVIYHWVLRLILSAKRLLPLRLSDFLDYAAEDLGFLQKVGGGYMFIHRYLLEHFAVKAVEGAPADRA
ncbi:MAG TPA: hypothetical protein VNJ70_03220 [Thermoanaerobaculia bacterium]|nr:hypothetical protein [Thermoanaerobaculia bacterium]